MLCLREFVCAYKRTTKNLNTTATKGQNTHSIYKCTRRKQQCSNKKKKKKTKRVAAYIIQMKTLVIRSCCVLCVYLRAACVRVLLVGGSAL